MRQKLIQTSRVPEVRPEKSRYTITNCASCHGFIAVNEPQITLPPERSFPFLPWQDAIVIVSLPNEVDPWDVFPIVKFVKVFEQKSFILHKDVHHTKATIIFGLQTMDQATIAGLWSSKSGPLQRQCLKYLLTWFLIVIGTSRQPMK